MPTGYITHPACLRHDMGAHHPESPARLRAIDDQLLARGLMDLLRHYNAPRATDAQICRVHDPGYLTELRAKIPKEGLVRLDPDTAMNPHTLEAAYRAAGAVVLATELVLKREVDNAFCAVRPPGHHAGRARAMGFCIFNNVAVGVAHALAQGVERIAILDFDVHRGNGTEALFRGDDRVLLCSSFQHPFYPYTHLDLASETAVLTPLPAGAGSAEFRHAVTEHWLPALEQFAPQMIFVSAGFDGHIEDDMASLRLLDDDYGWITCVLMELAARHAEGRVVSALEGGYALRALARSVLLHLRCLMKIDE